MKAILITVLLVGGWSILDGSKADKSWEQGNRYYQSELYEESIPYFKTALANYREIDDTWMVNITHCCLAFCYYNTEDYVSAERHMESIDKKVKIKDAEWNRSISDLYALFGKDDLQIIYLKRAKKYERD